MMKDQNSRLKESLNELSTKFEGYQELKDEHMKLKQDSAKSIFDQKTKISSLTSEIEILKKYLDSQSMKNSEVF